MDFARIPTVSADAVPADVPLLDVREDDEWAAGHPAGACHVPLGEVIQRLGEIVEHAAERRLYVVCRIGGRSAQVTAYLVQQGIDAVNIAGGLQAWQAAGRSLVSETATEPFVL